MSRAAQFLIFSVYCFISSESARILVVIPSASLSHQIVFRPLTQELARRGHEVVVVTTDPVFPKEEVPANLIEIDVHDISYEFMQKNWVELSTEKKMDSRTGIESLFEIVSYLFDMQVQNSEFKKIIEEKQHFDLLIIEAWVRPALYLWHIFKAPVIQMSSFGPTFPNYETIGAPTHPLLYPMHLEQKIYNLTLWDRANNLYNNWMLCNMLGEWLNFFDKAAEKTFGRGIPSVTELSNKIEMLFLHTHRIFEGNVPVPPSVVRTSGLQFKSENVLPTDLKTYIDNSKGVIYMSFGTNTDPANFPPDRIQMFIKVFSKLPYNILWKWNQDVLPGKTENIKISKWFPQADLLKHPKVMLFITQGGLQSTDEAICAGVPLIGIPLAVDQFYNSEKYVHLGIGMKLNIETVTEFELRKAIDEVIGNESYRRNIKKLGALMRDERVPPLQRAVWWVEHALRHGGARHLRAPAANMPWADYFEIELFCMVLGGITLFLVIVVYILCRYIRYFKSKLSRNWTKYD